jgi:hypothetical protein
MGAYPIDTRARSVPEDADTLLIVSTDISPFTLIESTPGKFSLLLSEFEPASEVFEAAGVEGGGYDWEAVARHIVENVETELVERVDFDSEASMFCAYGEDRNALLALGTSLAQLLRNHKALAKIVEAVGERGFDG